MKYRLPQTNDIVRYILAEYHPTDILDVNQALHAFSHELDITIKMAHLNYGPLEEYIHYLKHFKKYISSSQRNKDSILKRRLEEANKLRQLQQIL